MRDLRKKKPMTKKPKYYIIFTTEEGGKFKAMRIEGEEEAKAALKEYKESGLVETDSLTGNGCQQKKEKLAFVALVKELDNFDFVLGRKR